MSSPCQLMWNNRDGMKLAWTAGRRSAWIKISAAGYCISCMSLGKHPVPLCCVSKKLRLFPLYAAKRDLKYHWPAVSGQTWHWAKTRYWIKPEAPFLSRRCQMSECKELIQLTAARSFLSEPLKTKWSPTASLETDLEQVRLRWSKSSLCHGLLLICAQHNHYNMVA